tara:strand:- start:847 stop:1755 length:909 start_codon:yes stop_codon:yes gene_type:complete
MNHQTAQTIVGVTNALDKLDCDLLIVLGDRYETFAAVIAANLMNIKILHLHGGETTLGAIDDKIRHAITQMSTIHCTSADIHKEKVKRILGTEENVYNVGPMAIDGLLNARYLSKQEFQVKTGFNFGGYNFLITYHPETLSNDLGIEAFKKLLDILNDFDFNYLFTNPNADNGSEKIKVLIQSFVGLGNPKRLFIPSLGQELYLNGIKLFDCILGNSSSGLIEAPLLESKVINIGDRQKGRYKFGDVIDTKPDKESINKAIKKVISHKSISNQNQEINKNFSSQLESPSELIMRIINRFYNF